MVQLAQVVTLGLEPYHVYNVGIKSNICHCFLCVKLEFDFLQLKTKVLLRKSLKQQCYVKKEEKKKVALIRIKCSCISYDMLFMLI